MINKVNLVITNRSLNVVEDYKGIYAKIKPIGIDWIIYIILIRKKPKFDLNVKKHFSIKPEMSQLYFLKDSLYKTCKKN